MSGILNVDKPSGWTSHDVVSWIRRLLKMRRIGHAGTLDPLATGVLLICLGQATRVTEYLMLGRKSYRAEVQLGITTDTFDADGQVTASAPVPQLSEAVLRRVLSGFEGDIMQRPPVYSALKRQGVPLYRLARRGETVEPALRRVRIHKIALVSFGSSRVALDIDCDSGTYIRSLAHDVGAALGCGGMLTSLVRTRSGRFSLADALTLDAVAAAHRSGVLERHIHPLLAALDGFAALRVGPEAEQRLRQGQAIRGDASAGAVRACALASGGNLVAILSWDAAESVWRPEKVFDLES